MASNLHAPLPTDRLAQLHADLRALLDRQEAALGRLRPPSTLYDHSLRVARRARLLAERSRLAPPPEAYLAGLFHDAGKFRDGASHQDDTPEEEHSAALAQQWLTRYGVDHETIQRVTAAIRDLYREERNPGPLTRIIDDADNLDKLGLPGVAVFFIKAGLRGRGLGPALLHNLSVELTYARHAAAVMWTDAARELAAFKARRSEQLYRELLAELADDGLHDFRIEEYLHEGFLLLLVTRDRCDCGGEVLRHVESSAGVKCHEIRVTHTCRRCSAEHATRFCRPKIRPRTPCPDA